MAAPSRGNTSMKTHWQILVVDDEEVMCESLAAWLREDGYVVDTASPGHAAVEKARPAGARGGAIAREHKYEDSLADSGSGRRGGDVRVSRRMAPRGRLRRGHGVPRPRRRREGAACGRAGRRHREGTQV